MMKTLKISQVIHKDIKLAVAKSKDGETIQEFVEYALLAELRNRKNGTASLNKSVKK